MMTACDPGDRGIGGAGVPGSGLLREPGHRFIRFHFARQEGTLRGAAARLSRLREARRR